MPKNNNQNYNNNSNFYDNRKSSDISTLNTVKFNHGWLGYIKNRSILNRNPDGYNLNQVYAIFHEYPKKFYLF